MACTVSITVRYRTVSLTLPYLTLHYALALALTSYVAGNVTFNIQYFYLNFFFRKKKEKKKKKKKKKKKNSPYVL